MQSLYQGTQSLSVHYFLVIFILMLFLADKTRWIYESCYEFIRFSQDNKPETAGKNCQTKHTLNNEVCIVTVLLHLVLTLRCLCKALYSILWEMYYFYTFTLYRNANTLCMDTDTYNLMYPYACSYRIWESQNGWSWKGPLKVMWSNPSA